LLNKRKGNKNEKIYFVLLVAVLSFFTISKEIKGQDPCDVCQPPTFCFTFQLVTGLMPPCDIVNVTFCYDCYVIAPIVDINKISIEFQPNCQPSPNDLNTVFNTLNEWILNHIQDLYGLGDCNQPPPKEVYIYLPMCGDIVCNNGRLSFRTNNNCQLTCKSLYIWCWDFERNEPRFQRLWSIPYGDGSNCTPLERNQNDEPIIPSCTNNQNWILNCSEFPIDCPPVR